MKFIVNADDYGMDENVSHAICRFINDNVATQTTLMVNMPYCHDAVKMAKEQGFADKIGLHLNILEGVPLTEKIKRSHILCDGNGCFKDVIRHNKYLRFFLPRFEQAVIKEEFSAQMEKFLALGLPLRHVDSHGHLATSLSILPIFLDCAKRFGFKTTRLYPCLSSNEKGGAVSMMRKIYCKRVRSLIVKSGLKTTDTLGYPWDLMKIDPNFEGIVETFCHPQYRLWDGTKDMSGELKDWMTPAEVTYGFVRERSHAWKMCSFGDIAS